MENLSVWYSIAMSISDKSKGLKAELEAAEKIIESIESSMESSQSRMVELLESDATTLEELNMQEKHLMLLGRLLLRKRSGLVKTAADHCLKYISCCNLDNEEEYEHTKDVVVKVGDVLKAEKDLPKAKSNVEVYKALQLAISKFPASINTHCMKRRKEQTVC